MFALFSCARLRERKIFRAATYIFMFQDNAGLAVAGVLKATSVIYRFEASMLDTERRELFRVGVLCPLEP
jgi:hypothetical protein